MAETRKITFTNTSNGPRGVNGVNGVVLIEKGQSAEVEVTEAEFNSAMRTGYFGEGDKAEKPLDRHTKAELIEIAEREGVAVETDDNKADLVRKIEEARAA